MVSAETVVEIERLNEISYKYCNIAWDLDMVLMNIYEE